MTTISPADAHRSPAFLPSPSTFRPLKRQASSLASERKDDKSFRQTSEEKHNAKRQKLVSPTSASGTPVFSPSTSNANFIRATRLVRFQDAIKLPLELVNGFFVGSEGSQESLPQSPSGSRNSPPSLPQRPWKHSLLTRMNNEGSLNNSGVRRRNDMQVQTVPYKTEPPQDAPRFKPDSKQRE
jgi:hypothetical protein